MSINGKPWTKHMNKILIVVGVIIIPLAYSLFYLGAFWDPYSRLDSLPVAVVNNDEGAVVGGVERNLGDEMVERMRADSSLKWVFTDQQDGKAGVDGTKYYAMIVIPKDFSASLASADSTDKKTALLTYETNDKRNFLASQIFGKAVLELEEKARADADGELTQTLVNKLGDVPGKLQDLSDGLNEMGDGSGGLADGASTLADGQADLTAGAADLDGGLGDLKSGAQTLKNNMSALDAGLAQAGAGAKALSAGAANLPRLAGGISSLDAGAGDLKAGVDGYVAGVDALLAQNKQLGAAIANYVSRNPAAAADPALKQVLQQLSDAGAQLAALEQGGDDLKAGAASLKAGADELGQNTAGMQALAGGAAELSDALEQLKSGSSRLSTGAAALASGAKDAKAGSADLLDGAKLLQTGSADLLAGAKELRDAIGTAKGKVDESIADSNAELNGANGLGDYAKAPVTLQNETANSIPNYGTAFAPYFISLSLWVGALILFVGIYLDPDNRMPLLSRSSDRKFLRMAVFTAISLAQSCLLAFLLIRVLRLQVANLAAFYGVCVLVSIVFMSVVQFLIVNLGNAGKFLAILFLVLQLTACGGTFPMETVPGFFNVIYPYMPMTYSVNLLKGAIGGFGAVGTMKDAGILLGIFAAFTSATAGCAIARKKKAGQTKTVFATT